MDEAGRTLPPGERGEIVARGPLVMAGYYKNPAATAEASRHGWHHTGDVGYLDSDGYLYIVDRLKDMIITGGFNVYSTEVEQAVLAHPAVLDCAVVGLPDDKWGERVTAIIQPLRRPRRHRRGDPGLGQGPPRQREGPQAGRDLARPAPLPGRQDPQGRRQVPPAGRVRLLTLETRAKSVASAARSPRTPRSSSLSRCACCSADGCGRDPFEPTPGVLTVKYRQKVPPTSDRRPLRQAVALAFVALRPFPAATDAELPARPGCSARIVFRWGPASAAEGLIVLSSGGAPRPEGRTMSSLSGGPVERGANGDVVVNCQAAVGARWRSAGGMAATRVGNAPSFRGVNR